ncbi:MAG: ferredoxin:thioredoxin reductase [Candidatus Diapherotrites archaeon]|nr:ferredoxin:thioredoxin reductase [Candidatus Diapherotrites archaeon]
MENKVKIKKSKISIDSKEHAKENNLKLNPDSKIREAILTALAKNEVQHGKPYCPCRAITGVEKEDEKIVCPCIYHFAEVKEMGHCKCKLFFASDA